jgi:hypothetical protein
MDADYADYADDAAIIIYMEFIHIVRDIIFCLQANVVGAEVHHKSNLLANTVHESLL